MSKNKTTIGSEGIYDARVLGVPKMLVLGFQHMFAMFGATVLVPTLTGLSVSATLLFAGLGTLLFHRLLEEERKAGSQYMSLFTGEENPARFIYLGAGFRVVRTFGVLLKEL